MHAFGFLYVQLKVQIKNEEGWPRAFCGLFFTFLVKYDTVVRNNFKKFKIAKGMFGCH